MQISHLRRVAKIHAAALAGDFLPSLGVDFLHTFYRAALSSGAAFGFVLLQSDLPAGFVLGSADTDALFRRVLFRAPLALAWAGLPAILRQPRLLEKVAETFLYPHREAVTPVKAELVVIAVEPECRSQGAGHALVQALNTVFQAQGVVAYKVTVLQSNSGANRFYQREGFNIAGEFELYHKRWNLYTLSLER